MSDRELLDMLERQEELQRAAAAAYAATQKLGRLSSHRLLSYRCPRRCLLRDIARFPEPVGVVLHQPAFKMSPVLNKETSNESGRAANTTDGDRRWKSQTFRPAQAINVTLTCDHLEHAVLELDDVQADLDAGHAVVVVNSDGTRKAR